MLISYKWLQSYFEEKLPPPEVLAERITFAFAEVEAIEAIANTERDGTKPTRNETENDYIFDIKVLPDRACYALSHRGVAYEVAAILGKNPVDIRCPQRLRISDIHRQVEKVRPLNVRVEAPDLCSRYMARVIENITPREMPWVKEHLEAVSQRTIHPVVDGANIVMFDMGQPLHAFDADKVEGGIIVRRAQKGEKITTLDNREVLLDESVLVIADERAPLALAGIKGGVKAAVTAATRNLILEAASFNPSYIRKTAERLSIKTDASKRFENNLSPEMASAGLHDFTAFLFESDKNIRAGEIIDWYPAPQKERKIAVSSEYISHKLGIKLSASQIEEVLSRLLIVVEKNKNGLLLTPPAFRMDLHIPEDIAEEVGRLVGYDKIPSVLPIPLNKGGARVGEGGGCEIPNSFYHEWKIREILVNHGFSEVMTSSFGEKGNISIEKPLAEDKKYARQNLRGNFEKALKMNALNVPMFGTGGTRIFEIGQVFPKGGEHTALALGYAGPKKKGSPIQEMLALFRDAGIDVSGEERSGVFESTTTRLSLVEKWDITIPSVTSEKFTTTRLSLVEKWDITIPSVTSEKFKPFSSYPFIVRDVALFVSPLIKGVPPSSEAGVVFPSAESVSKVIKENAGNLVVRGPALFDEFSKGGKKSLAFRLVFQSFNRTLSDEEVNKQMEEIYVALKEKGWEVR